MSTPRPPCGKWRDVVDEDEQRHFWREASAREKGEALVDLLGLVDAMGRHPEPRTRFPGFPKRGRNGGG